MKRLFIFLSFFVLMGLNGQAQIQNKIYNLVIGVSTKADVQNYFNLHPDIETEEDEIEGTIDAYGLRFGGCYWMATYFSFYKGILAEVFFSTIVNEDISEADLNRNWEKLQKNLTKKYGQYYQKEYSTEERLMFADDKMALFLEYNKKGEKPILQLCYKDMELNAKEIESDADEL